MPRKLALQPRELKHRLLDLQETYGSDIIQRAMNLYQYCFSGFTSYQIQALRAKGAKALPLVNNNSRELGMTYVFLLSEILKPKKKNFWNDAIFIIYFTYWTGWNHEGRKTVKLDFKTLNMLVNIYDPLSYEEFQKSFNAFKSFNFSAPSTVNSASLKRSLIEKVSSFRKKYKNHEQVEFFLKISLKTINNGL